MSIYHTYNLTCMSLISSYPIFLTVYLSRLLRQIFTFLHQFILLTMTPKIHLPHTVMHYLLVYTRPIPQTFVPQSSPSFFPFFSPSLSAHVLSCLKMHYIPSPVELWTNPADISSSIIPFLFSSFLFSLPTHVLSCLKMLLIPSHSELLTSSRSFINP